MLLPEHLLQQAEDLGSCQLDVEDREEMEMEMEMERGMRESEIRTY